MLPDCQVRLVTHLLEPEVGEGKNYKNGYKHERKLETGYLQIYHIEELKAQSHNANRSTSHFDLALVCFISHWSFFFYPKIKTCLLLVLPFELSCFGALLSSFANNDQEVLREHKGHAFSLVPKLLLFVVKEMAKVYVEQLWKHTNSKKLNNYLRKKQKVCIHNTERMTKCNLYLSIIFDHNVAIVSVPYAQDECGYTVACTWPREQIYGLVIPKKSNKWKILYSQRGFSQCMQLSP